MNPSSNPLVMLLDIFRSPTACFLALYQRGAWGWQPYVVLMLSPFLFWGAYFSNVDFTWLSAELTRQLAQTTQINWSYLIAIHYLPVKSSAMSLVVR